MTKKDCLISIMSFCIVATLLGVGFFAGRYTIVKNFSDQITAFSKAYLLGSFLDSQQKKDMAGCYTDPDSVLKKIDEISWAVPNIPTPFVGGAPMPGRHGTAVINSMQFRATTEVIMPKPAFTYRIFLTGGSTAFGSGSPSQEHTIAGYLSQLITRTRRPESIINYEIVTAANPGWASTQERILIENRISELDPDMVISFSGINDVDWGRLGRNVLWFRNYPDEFFLNLIKTAYKITKQPALPEIANISSTEVPPDIVAKRLIKNIEISAHVLGAAKTRYVFVLQPALAVTHKALTDRELRFLNHQDYFRSCYTKIGQALRNFHAANWQYIDLSEIFDSLGAGQDIFLDSFHFGDKGNAIIAEKIFQQIKDRL